MKKLIDMKPGRIIGFAGVVGLVFLVFWLALIFISWRLFGLARYDGNLWAAIEGLSGAATLASVIGGGVVALAQLVESIDGRKREMAAQNLAAYNDIFDDMISERNIAARRWIYMNLADDPAEGLAALSDEGRSHVKLVLNSFDRLGFMLQQDLIASEEIIGWMSPFVVKVWARLGPYVEHEAARRDEPDYYEAARFLAERCAAWRQENVPGADAEVKWVEDAL